jgi:hypothetical protein
MLLFGALTEAGIAISRGDPATPTRAQLREALVGLVLEPA